MALIVSSSLILLLNLKMITSRVLNPRSLDSFERNPALDNSWNLFKCQCVKTYSSPEEEAMRRHYWETNFDFIARHNELAKLGVYNYTLADNYLADYSDEERMELKQLRVGRCGSRNTAVIDDNTLEHLKRQNPPKSYDLRTDPCLGPVKHQRKCGACWAFAATTPLEYQACKSAGKPVSLSEQQLIDCSARYGNNGCSSGFYSRAWNYIYNARGIYSLTDYPYKASPGNCTPGGSYTKKTEVQTWVYLPADEKLMLRALVDVGPISVSLDGSHKTFDFYAGGVYEEPRCSTAGINHGGSIVGYGTLNGVDYWILRNSWGPRWGMDGYMLLKRGSNTCSVASFASYPIVNKNE